MNPETAGVQSPLPPTPSGLILIDKPLKLTSMTVCAAIRRRFVAAGAPKRIKVGHGGTLDPLATGLLVVLVGKATKMCEQVMAGEKRYLTDIDLSVTSPTDDLEGPLTRVDVASPPSLEAVAGAISGFVGDIQQRPPIYSAMKIDGERAYKLARRAEGGRGEIPQMAARTITVHTIDIIEYRYPHLRLDIRCGKGTYIRSIARDLGAALGVGGCLSGLRRTQVGRFTIEHAVALDSLPPILAQADLLSPA